MTKNLPGNIQSNLGIFCHVLQKDVCFSLIYTLKTHSTCTYILALSTAANELSTHLHFYLTTLLTLTYSECTWKGPIEGFLSGCAGDGCKNHNNMDEAKEACSKDELCTGLIKVAKNREVYQLRSGAKVSDSPSGEQSWTKTCGTLTCFKVFPSSTISQFLQLWMRRN